jgi:hypothetical protein
MSKRVGRCTHCGLQAEVDDVTIMQIVGLVIVFQWKKMGGSWCRRCTDKELVPATLLSMFMGWWGLISFFLTPIFLAVNTWTFLKTRALTPPPGG